MKLEAMAIVGVSYAASGSVAAGNYFMSVAANLAQQAASAPVAQPADIFWPAFGGAFLASLWTIEPAFRKGADIAPSAAAMRAFISLTGGFLIAFYFTLMLSPWVRSFLPFSPPPGSVSMALAVALGILGEKGAAVLFMSTPADWGRWLKSLLPWGKP